MSDPDESRGDPSHADILRPCSTQQLFHPLSLLFIILPPFVALSLVSASPNLSHTHIPAVWSAEGAQRDVAQTKGTSSDVGHRRQLGLLHTHTEKCILNGEQPVTLPSALSPVSSPHCPRLLQRVQHLLYSLNAQLHTSRTPFRCPPMLLYPHLVRNSTFIPKKQ